MCAVRLGPLCRNRPVCFGEIQLCPAHTSDFTSALPCEDQEMNNISVWEINLISRGPNARQLVRIQYAFTTFGSRWSLDARTWRTIKITSATAQLKNALTAARA